MFCMRNIQKAIDQPPLDVVESIATIFSCLKDLADISQVCTCSVRGLCRGGEEGLEGRGKRERWKGREEEREGGEREGEGGGGGVSVYMYMRERDRAI